MTDIKRSILYTLGNPPGFEGDFDKPWFAPGPTPESAIVARVRGLSGADRPTIRAALSRLEDDGFLRRVRPGGTEASLSEDDGWELTAQGGARADRLDGDYISELRSREREGSATSDDFPWLTHFTGGNLR